MRRELIKKERRKKIKEIESVKDNVVKLGEIFFWGKKMQQSKSNKRNTKYDEVKSISFIWYY